MNTTSTKKKSNKVSLDRDEYNHMINCLCEKSTQYDELTVLFNKVIDDYEERIAKYKENIDLYHKHSKELMDTIEIYKSLTDRYEHTISTMLSNDKTDEMLEQLGKLVSTVSNKEEKIRIRKEHEQRSLSSYFSWDGFLSFFRRR